MGFDVAEFGTDANVACFRYGSFVERIIAWGGVDIIQSAERAIEEYRKRQLSMANIDATGVGAGAAPIKTPEGWLEIYHGANEENRYCLGAILLDLKDPSKVLARSKEPLFEPTSEYELTGFFGNVVFTNGQVVDGDKISLYYGASDEVICGATFSIQDILAKILAVAST